MERASEARGCDSGAFGWTTGRERPARSTPAKRPREAPKKACSAGAPNRSGARDRLTSKARRTQPRPVAHHHLLRSSTLVRSQVLGMPPHQVACDQRRVAAPGCLTTRTRAPSNGGPRVASRCDRSAQSLDEFEHGLRARHSNEGATASRDELACERPAATAQTLTCRHNVAGSRVPVATVHASERATIAREKRPCSAPLIGFMASVGRGTKNRDHGGFS